MGTDVEQGTHYPPHTPSVRDAGKIPEHDLPAPIDPIASTAPMASTAPAAPIVPTTPFGMAPFTEPVPLGRDQGVSHN